MCRVKFLTILVLIGGSTLITNFIQATSFVWVGGSGPAPSSWSNTDNWQPSGVPSVSDDVTIPASANNPELDATAKINSLTLTGTETYLTLDGTHSLTVVTTLTIGSSSAHVRTGSSILIVGGTVSGTGELDLSGNGTLKIAGDLSISSLTAGSGGTSLVSFNGTSQKITNGYEFNNLQIGSSQATGTTVTMNADQKVDITLSGCGTLNCSAYKLTLIGDMTLKYFNAGTGTVQLYGSSNYQSQDINGYSFYNLSINNNLTYLAGNVTVSHALDFQSGDISLRSYNFTVASGATVTWNNDITPDATAGYFITGSTGYVTMTASTLGTLFPVGYSGVLYNPVTIIPSTGGINFNVSVSSGITDQTNTILASGAVNQTWLVVPQNAVTSVSVTPQWTDGTNGDPAQELNSFNRIYSYVATRSTLTNPSPWSNTSSTGSASGGDPWTRNSGSFSMQSGTSYYIGVLTGAMQSIAPLPVTLTDFEAVYDQHQVNLSWTTASEINNRYFEIERSANGTDWSTIGTVAGHGEAQSMNQYSSADPLTETVFSGTMYYRLKQVDFNGTFTLSAIRPVYISAHPVTVNTYPNPAHDLMNIEWTPTDKMIALKILNLNGNILYQENLAGELNTQRQINLSRYPSGSYILQVVTETNTVSKVIYKN
jgi:hypothetical protein